MLWWVKDRQFKKITFITPNNSKVTGDVNNVNFGNKAKSCIGSGEETLPQNIIYIDQDKKLTNGDVILIGGIIENGIGESNITVSFYYEALDWHEKCLFLKII